MSTQPKGQFREKLQGYTILRPGVLPERARDEAARNLRRKLLIGAAAGFATLVIGWSLNALRVINAACEVVSAVSLLVDSAVAYFWPAARTHIGPS